MRISVFVIEVVRTLDELYNVRCSVRTVLVRSRNNNDHTEAAAKIVVTHFDTLPLVPNKAG